MKIPTETADWSGLEGNVFFEISDEPVAGLCTLTLFAHYDSYANAEINRDQAEQIVDHLTRVFALEKKA